MKTKKPKKITLKAALATIKLLNERVENLEKMLKKVSMERHTDNLMTENVIRTLVTVDNCYKLKLFTSTGPANDYHFADGSSISRLGVKDFLDELYQAVNNTKVKEHRTVTSSI